LKTSALLSEVIRSEVVDLACRFLLCEETDFHAHINLLGLNPKTDFRYADLACIDLSNSDLRGFDFTGSDLQGATGVNVKWDDSTILDHAQLADSLFEYRLARERFFVNNPLLHDEVQRLSKSYWTQTILGVERRLRKEGDSVDSTRIAQAVFDGVSDITVKSNILFFMRLALVDKEAHKGFIYNIFAQHSDNLSIVRAAIRALSSLYRNDLGAFNILVKYMGHKDKSIREEALNGVVGSKHLLRVFDMVHAHVMSSTNSLVRRMFLGRAARLAGPEFLAAAHDADVLNYLDFAETISYRKVFLGAQTALLNEKSDRMIEYESYRIGELEGLLDINEGQIAKRAKKHRELLEALRDQFKIPLVFNES
jgi:pentapeptide repeat protein